MKEYTIEDFKKLFSDDSAKSHRQRMQFIIDSSLSLIQETDDFSKADAHWRDAHLMFQLATLRAISILNLSIENVHVNQINNSKLNAIDVTSMYTLLRSITESFCIFNNIYACSKSEEELILKYKIWLVSGLKNRQSAEAALPEFVQQKEQESLQIETLIDEIQSNSVFCNLSPVSQARLLNEVRGRKNYQIVIDNDIAKHADWKELLFRAKVKKELFQDVILYTTLNSHPSSIAILQFGGRYSDPIRLENDIATCLRLTSAMLSFFVVDYIIYVLKKLNSFHQLSKMHKEVIKMYETAFRMQKSVE